MKACPFCAESIQDEAIVCRYCNREIGAVGENAAGAQPPRAQVESKTTKKSNRVATTIFWVLIVGVLVGGGGYYYYSLQPPACANEKTLFVLKSLASEAVLEKGMSIRQTGIAMDFATLSIDSVTSTGWEGKMRTCSAQLNVALSRGAAELAARYAQHGASALPDPFAMAAMVMQSTQDNPSSAYKLLSRDGIAQANMELQIEMRALVSAFESAWTASSQSLSGSLRYTVSMNEDNSEFSVGLRPSGLIRVQSAIKLLAMTYVPKPVEPKPAPSAAAAAEPQQQAPVEANREQQLQRAARIVSCNPKEGGPVSAGGAKILRTPNATDLYPESEVGRMWTLSATETLTDASGVVYLKGKIDRWGEDEVFVLASEWDCQG